MSRRIQNIILLLCLILIFLISSVKAQVIDTLWTKTYGGVGNDAANCVRQTPKDNGYIIVGYTGSFGAGGADIYLIKTDEYGDTLWTRTYGGEDDDFGSCIQLTSDEGYIIAGYTWSFGTGDMDAWIIKTNSYGDTLWTKTFGGPFTDRGYSIEKTNDGSSILSGFTQSVYRMSELFLVKIDEEGDTLWTRTIGGTSDDCGHYSTQISDGGYIATGFTHSYGMGTPQRYNVFLARTDTNGDTLWTKNFGGDDDDEGWVVQETSDGGFIIVGDSWSFQPGNSHVYLIKTDSDGNELWTKLYGRPYFDQGFCLQQTSDNGFIIAGLTSADDWNEDIYLIRTDEFGDSLWTGHIGHDFLDVGKWIELTIDGCYIIAGYTKPWGESDSDVFLVKTTPDQTNAIYEDDNKLPMQFNLSQNHPNPFNASTVISYSILFDSKVTIEVYDITFGGSAYHQPYKKS